MGYYTRVFCRSENSPDFSELREYINRRSPLYRLEAETDDKKADWTNLELHYKEGKHPIVIELNWCNEDGSVGKEELAEFLDDIGMPVMSLKKRKVIRQIKQTKYIVCSQLLSDLDDDGYNANEYFMQFFVEQYQGMMHADNEGFYNGDGTLLLKHG